jgi:hypothetical protein
MGLKSGTNHGTPADLICPAMMEKPPREPSLLASFANVLQCSREKRVYTNATFVPPFLSFS